MGWGIPRTPLVTEQSQGCEDKGVKHRLGPSFVLLPQVPRMLEVGLPEPDHINLLYQNPSLANAGNSFQPHPLDWTLLNRNQLLSEGCAAITDQDTNNICHPVSDITRT